MRFQRWIGVTALTTAALLAGCQGSQHASSPTTAAATSQPAPTRSTKTALTPVNPNLPPPPGLTPQTVQPRAAASMPAAQKKLDEVLMLVAPPAYLRNATPATQPTPAPSAGAEPPLAAQQAYARGRIAWKQRQTFEAIRQLEQALTIAPEHPEILRQLAQVYIAGGNRVRGAAVLERAVASDPNDGPTLFMLGRLSFEQGQWANAVHLLWRAINGNLAATEPELIPLARYFLGGALERMGHDEAAVKLFRAFLDSSSGNASWSSQRSRDLTLLLRQRGVVWMIVGDLHNRLGQPSQAWDAYQQGIEQGVGDGQTTFVRLLYTLLQLGRFDEAEQLVIDRLTGAQTDDATLDLVSYVAKHGSRTKRLTERLEQLYAQSGKPARLALALASLQTPPRSSTTLKAHLASKPADRAVFEALIKHYNAQSSAGDIAELLRSVEPVLSAAPQIADTYATQIVEQLPIEPLLQSWDKLAPPERSKAMLRLIRGLSLGKAQRVDEATTELAAALEADPKLTAARLVLARVALAKNDIEQAQKLLEPLTNSEQPEVVALLVRVLAQTQRQAEALKLLDRLLAQQPGNVELVLTKANLQLRTGDSSGAETTLLDALNSKPEEEKFYETLFNLYESPQAPPESQGRGYQRLMRRVLEKMPNSRIARLKRAELHAAGSEFPQAETLLRQLLTENPLDYAAIDNLLDMLVRTQRNAEADALLNDRLQKHPQDRNLLTVALQHFRNRVRDKAKAAQVEERAVNLLPPGADRDAALVIVLLRNGQHGRAAETVIKGLASKPEDPKPLLGLLGIALVRAKQVDRIDAEFKAVLQLYPKLEAEVTYEWAMAYEVAGNKARSEQILIENTTKHPEHAQSNNGLGYAWADQGRNLEKAKELIQRAIEAEPNRAEYLDSMGWVYYKLGNFAEAVTWLQRARAEKTGAHPVIVDHLGDALYQVGRTDEAVRAWRQAQELLMARKAGAEIAEEIFDSPELKALEKTLPPKLDAAANNRRPQLAPLGEGIAVPANAGNIDAPAAKPANRAAPR